jgi:tetratricopeptide (TPR) repeat protein
LLAVAVLTITWFMGGTAFYLVEALAILLLFFPFVLILYQARFGPGARYVRLLRAIGHAEWDKALRLIPEIQLPLSPVELPTLKAQALAGLGELDDALMTIDDLADNPDLPRYLYWMVQSVIYQEAQSPEKLLGALQQAHELAPTMSLPMIAYAGMLISTRRDVNLARDLLRRAKRQAISLSAMPYLHHAEGLLALHEGRTAEAVESLSNAVRLYEPYVRWNQSLLQIDARMRSRFCLALAASGDTNAAKQQFRIAKPILEAHRDEDLLRKCEEAIG